MPEVDTRVLENADALQNRLHWAAYLETSHRTRLELNVASRILRLIYFVHFVRREPSDIDVC